MSFFEPGKSEDIVFIEKIAKTMGKGFGAADSFGTVIYPAAGQTLVLPDDDADTAELNGKLFCMVRAEGRDLWFFDDVPGGGEQGVESGLKALKIAAAFYTETVTASSTRRSEFFRQLLLGGKDQALQGDFTVNTKKNSPASEYTVLLVTLAKGKTPEDRERDGRISEVFTLLEYAFPENEGYVNVRIRPDACTVIVPLSEEMQFENALEAAESVIDTVRTELAIEITVSVGCRVKLLRNIDASYRTADRALAIGEAFDIGTGVYSYDSLGVARILYGQKRDVCESYLKEVFGVQFFENSLRVQEGETRSAGDEELIFTIKMYLKYNQNVTETAKALFVHRNTLNYRIEKFNKLTGLDCTEFEDGVKISIGFMVASYLETLQPQGDDGSSEKRVSRETGARSKKQQNKR